MQRKEGYSLALRESAIQPEGSSQAEGREIQVKDGKIRGRREGGGKLR